MTKKLSLPVLLLLLLAACGVNRTHIAAKATGPKDLYVKLTSDPLLISLELRQALEQQGYRVNLSTEDSPHAVMKETPGGATIYTQVSKSAYRYELDFGYQSIQGRVRVISAQIWDRNNNRLLGTYRWTWNRLLPAPTVEDAVKQVQENLLSKVFGK